MWEFPIGKCIFLVFHIIFVFGRWLWVCLLTCKQSLQAHVNQAASSAIMGMGWKDRWTSSLMPRDGPDLSTLIDPETLSTLVSSALFFFFFFDISEYRRLWETKMKQIYIYIFFRDLSFSLCLHPMTKPSHCMIALFWWGAGRGSLFSRTFMALALLLTTLSLVPVHSLVKT